MDSGHQTAQLGLILDRVTMRTNDNWIRREWGWMTNLSTMLIDNIEGSFTPEFEHITLQPSLFSLRPLLLGRRLSSTVLCFS